MLIELTVPEVVIPGMKALQAGRSYEVDDKTGQMLIARGQAALVKTKVENPEEETNSRKKKNKK